MYNDLLLEFTRVSIAGFCILYLLYAFESFILYKQSSYKSIKAYHTIFFALALSGSCASKLYGLYTSETDHFLYYHPLIFMTGNTSLFFYSKIMKENLAGGNSILKFIKAIGLIAISISIVSILLNVFTDINLYGTIVKDVGEKSSVLYAFLGDHLVRPRLLLKLSFLTSTIFLVTVLCSMIIGRLKGRYQSKLLVFGVILSTVSAIIEIFLPFTFPKYYFDMFCFSNLPELIRTTVLVKHDMLMNLLNKEKEIAVEMSERLSNDISEPINTIQNRITMNLNSHNTKIDDVVQENIETLKKIINRVK
jgi:hypothetical protein